MSFNANVEASGRAHDVLINSSNELEALHGELEGRKVSGKKQLAWKVLGVALAVITVAIGVFALLSSIISPLAMILAMPSIVVAYGIGAGAAGCISHANNSAIKEAQAILKDDIFIAFANKKSKTKLTMNNIYEQIDQYTTYKQQLLQQQREQELQATTELAQAKQKQKDAFLLASMG